MKIAIFYHVFCVNHWEDVFREQIEALKDSGLANVADYIQINIVGTEWDYSMCRFYTYKILAKEGNLAKIEMRNTQENTFEYGTLKNLHEYCQSNNGAVLYLHTKGVANRQAEENQAAWRRYMQYFCVEKWQDCLKKLSEEYDCCGVNWWGDMEKPHFSGNFWWADCEYVAKLPELLPPWTEGLFRTEYEFWIGYGKPKAHSFCQNGKAFYLTKIEESEYKICREEIL